MNADDYSPIKGNDGAVLGYAILRSGGPKQPTNGTASDGSTLLELTVALTEASGLYFALPEGGGASGNVETSITTFMPQDCPFNPPTITRQNGIADCSRRRSRLTFDVPTNLFNCSSANEFVEGSSKVFFLMVRVDLAAAPCASASKWLWAGSDANTIRTGCSFITVTATCKPATCPGFVAPPGSQLATDRGGGTGAPGSGGTVVLRSTSSDDAWKKVVPGVAGGAAGALILTIVVAGGIIYSEKSRRYKRRLAAHAKRRASQLYGGGGGYYGSRESSYSSSSGGDGAAAAGGEMRDYSTSRMLRAAHTHSHMPGHGGFAGFDFSFSPAVGKHAASDAHMRRMRLHSVAATNQRTLGSGGSVLGGVAGFAGFGGLTSRQGSTMGNSFWQTDTTKFMGVEHRKRSDDPDEPEPPEMGVHFFQSITARQAPGPAVFDTGAPSRSIVIGGRQWDLTPGRGGVLGFSSTSIPVSPGGPGGGYSHSVISQSMIMEEVAPLEPIEPQDEAWADVPDLPGLSHKRTAASAYRPSPDNPIAQRLEALAAAGASAATPSVMKLRGRPWLGTQLETIESAAGSGAPSSGVPSGPQSSAGSEAPPSPVGAAGTGGRRGSHEAAGGLVARTGSGAAAARVGSGSRLQRPGEPHARGQSRFSVSTVADPTAGGAEEEEAAAAATVRAAGGAAAGTSGRNLRVPSRYDEVMSGMAAAATAAAGPGSLEPRQRTTAPAGEVAFVELGRVSDRTSCMSATSALTHAASGLEEEAPPQLQLPDWVAQGRAAAQSRYAGSAGTAPGPAAHAEAEQALASGVASAAALAAAAEIAARGRLSPAGRLAAHNLPPPPSPSRLSGLQPSQQQPQPQLQEQESARHPAAPQFAPGVRMLLESEPGPSGDRSVGGTGHEAHGTPRGAAVRALEKPLSPGPFAPISAGGALSAGVGGAAAGGAGATPGDFSAFGDVAPEVALVLGSKSVVFSQGTEFQGAEAEAGAAGAGSASAGGLLSFVPGLQAFRSRLGRKTEESPRTSSDAGYAAQGYAGGAAGMRAAEGPSMLRPSESSLTQLQEGTPNVSLSLGQPLPPPTQEQELQAEGAAGSSGSGLLSGRLLLRLTGRSGAARSPSRGSRTGSPRRRESMDQPFDSKEE
ncbi:hypothetical protein HYH02_001991 [Chlamydomonas schloesseri]|uniref:Uncharacterized protein n=1 Tax=Chlamydomonas schloesseri TaxID=2026947 RepID=A0A835WUR5_9CHLO|nr:hypothetical protein HYH02_001991 [Chlamydomonas schloesseri]|eukprot:KAG2453782.1 hypothetical protein HYH02_001991 [Chlamydomonas schloesseri]